MTRADTFRRTARAAMSARGFRLSDAGLGLPGGVVAMRFVKSEQQIHVCASPRELENNDPACLAKKRARQAAHVADLYAAST